MSKLTIAVRLEILAQEMRQLQDDIDHWNRMHPNEEPIVIDADLSAEVAALRKTVEYENRMKRLRAASPKRRVDPQ